MSSYPVSTPIPAHDHVTDYVVLGCFASIVGTESPSKSIVTAGARCPENLLLEEVTPENVLVTLLHGPALSPTAVLHVDAGPVRFHCMFNLSDRQTRQQLEKTTGARGRLDVLLESAMGGGQQVRFSIAHPFDQLLRHELPSSRGCFQDWMDAAMDVVPEWPTLASEHPRGRTLPTLHCPVLMLPPWRCRLELGKLDVA